VDKITNDLSDNISSDLQRRGMKFVSLGDIRGGAF